MVRTLVLGLMAFFVISLFVLWILNGGPREVAGGAKGAIDFARFDPRANQVEMRLPWTPAQLFPTIDIGTALQFEHEDAGFSSSYDIDALEAEYERIARDAAELSELGGTPSPHRGRVLLTDMGGARESEPGKEYVVVNASFQNTAPVDLTGWSIESTLTGIRRYVPNAAAPLATGAENTLQRVLLAPGATAIIASGPSPVGLSFRENMCTGYLSQFQSFEPWLLDECPSPSQVLPLTPSNLARYGETCFDALATIPRCRFPQSLPGHVSPACASHLTSSLSYNGCVRDNQYRSGFHSDAWRLFLGSPTELWRNTRDSLRLLDSEGRVVSTYTY